MVSGIDLCRRAVEETFATPMEGIPKFPIGYIPKPEELERLATRMREHANNVERFAKKLRKHAATLPDSKPSLDSDVVRGYQEAVAVYKAPHFFGHLLGSHKRTASYTDMIELAVILESYSSRVRRKASDLAELVPESRRIETLRSEKAGHRVALQRAKAHREAEGE